MMTGRGKEAWERMTPEQRAAVEAIRAKNRTPDAQAENERIAAEAREAHPPIEVDDSLAQLLAGLKREREGAGLSLADIADRTGLDRATVQGLESGRLPNPTYSMLRAFASAVGCRVALGLERARAEIES